MAVVTCPNCGSDDLKGAPGPANGTLQIHCLACGRTFAREPALRCKRCGSTNVAVHEYQGWGYDDIEDARENPEGGSWSRYDRQEYRCLDCHHDWRTSGPGQPYEAEV